MTPAPISVERLREVVAIVNGPLLSCKANDHAAWEAVSFLQDQGLALLQQLAEREAEVYLLRSWLCDCFVNAGADTDGSTDVRALSERAVQAVIDLRRDYDENEDWKGRACAAERAREEATGLLKRCETALRVGECDMSYHDEQGVRRSLQQTIGAFLAASGGK